jgi:DNA-binding transcriptional ArsR family regulator
MIKYQETELDRTFGALADPTRRRFVTELRAGDRTVSQLCEKSEMSLVAVLKHVQILEESGLIRTEKKGRSRVCSFHPEKLQHAESWLAETRSFWTSALHSLNDFLQEEKR